MRPSASDSVFTRIDITIKTKNRIYQADDLRTKLFQFSYRAEGTRGATGTCPPPKYFEQLVALPLQYLQQMSGLTICVPPQYLTPSYDPAYHHFPEKKINECFSKSYEMIFLGKSIYSLSKSQLHWSNRNYSFEI